jgi:tyrosyl-tRNA synthetase
MANINEILTRRVKKILPSKKEFEKLLSKRKITLYLGIDPTATRLHLGHTVGLRKLMDFANAGHKAILLFGTGTVLVGDPSERESARKLITEREINKNIKNWKKQISPIVDFNKIKIKKNNDWLVPLTLKEIIKIASNISAVQLFKRDMFQRRISRGDTVWYHETMYPLLQGYDSVVLDVDLEIGGTDQEFNMLIGRELLKKMKKKKKFVITYPMILGTDGQEMSKTSKNCIWLDDTAEDMFGKIMSIPDTLIVTYMDLATNIPTSRVKKVDSLLKSNNLSPIQAKKELAIAVVSEFYDKSIAYKTEEEFEKTFQKRELPSKLTVKKVNESSMNLLNLVSESQLVPSRSQAKRLILQKAVEIDGKVVSDPHTKIEISQNGLVLKVGKRRYIKIMKV